MKKGKDALHGLTHGRCPKSPTIRLERIWSERNGGACVAGVDEAGRGPLAGPVVAAAVIWPMGKGAPAGLNDSKQVSAETREWLFGRIQAGAVSWGIGIAEAAEIDMINILEATRLAAARALAQLRPVPQALVTDCLTLPKDARPQLPVVKGDAKCIGVAAASILAKETRDRLMMHYHEEFPQYGWNANKGYPTPDHLEAIERHGPCILHRLTFRGVAFFCDQPLRSPTYLRLCEALTRDGGSRDSVREELEEYRHRLPPPDVRDIEALLSTP